MAPKKTGSHAQGSQEQQTSQTPTDITLERSKGPALTFCGHLVKQVVGESSGTRNGERRHILALYRVASLRGDGDKAYEGGYALAVEYATTFHDDMDQKQAYLANTSEDVWRCLAGHNPRRDVKIAAGSFAEKRRERIYRDVTDRFNTAAHGLLSALPELNERTIDLHWRCDVCGKPVTTADGWLEWRGRGGNLMGYALRIVHCGANGQAGCRYDNAADRELVRDGEPLVEFLGPDGLMYLIGLITEEICPTDKVLEMLKRLHVPRYEAARMHFEKARKDGIGGDPHLPVGAFTQDMLSEIIVRYGSTNA